MPTLPAKPGIYVFQGRRWQLCRDAPLPIQHNKGAGQVTRRRSLEHLRLHDMLLCLALDRA
jgi:hypothetical protein